MKNYKKRYCEAICEHFSELQRDKKGKISGIPSFISFARSEEITLRQIESWRASHPEFDSACLHALELQKQLLLDGALSGNLNTSAAKFILSSEFGMQAVRGDPGGATETISEADRRLIDNLCERLGYKKDGKDEKEPC